MSSLLLIWFLFDRCALVVKSTSVSFVCFHVTQMYQCVCVFFTTVSPLDQNSKARKTSFPFKLRTIHVRREASLDLQCKSSPRLPPSSGLLSVSLKSIFIRILFFRMLLFHWWIYGHLFILFWPIYQKVTSHAENNCPHFNKKQTVYVSLHGAQCPSRDL